MRYYPLPGEKGLPVVMVSGGLDSFLCAELCPTAALMFVDYGQRYAEQELAACRAQHSQPILVYRFPPPRPLDPESVYVPARNLTLATLATWAGYSTIVMGGMQDDNCPDKTPAAFEDMSRVLTLQAGRDIHVASPFWDTPKVEAVADYLAAGGTPAKLLQTWSCYRPEGPNMCHDCPACFRWLVALRANRIDVPRPSAAITQEYVAKLAAYSPERREAIRTAFNAWGVPL